MSNFRETDEADLNDFTKINFWGVVTIPTFSKGFTPPKTNMEPENEPLEEEIPIKHHHVQVPCSFSGVFVPPKKVSLAQRNPPYFPVTSSYLLTCRLFRVGPEPSYQWSYFGAPKFLTLQNG